MDTHRPHPAALAPTAIRRQNPRQEPSALAVHAGICAGGVSNGGPYRDFHCSPRAVSGPGPREAVLAFITVRQTRHAETPPTPARADDVRGAQLVSRSLSGLL